MPNTLSRRGLLGAADAFAAGVRPAAAAGSRPDILLFITDDFA